MSDRFDEELARVKRITLTRTETRAEADALFGGEAAAMRKKDTDLVRKLFVQAPAVQTTAANLELEKKAGASPAPAVDSYLEKLASSSMTEAQRRFPELLKVASPKLPNVAPKKNPAPGQGTGSVRSMLSGGSA